MGLTDDIVPGARQLRRAVMLALFALIAGALDVAAGGPDRRLRVDADTMPWRAIGKLQAVSENFRKTCTGSLVGPALVLSAAHCLFNPRTGHFFPPGSVHFLNGYEGGRYVGHAVGTAVEIGAGYDPARSKETLGSDWALIKLNRELGAGDRVLETLREPPPVGADVVLGGYQRDSPLVIVADTDCRILGHAADADGRALVQHSCAGLPGLSGAPLLTEMGGTWLIAGVAVAEKPGTAGGLAALPDSARVLGTLGAQPAVTRCSTCRFLAPSASELRWSARDLGDLSRADDSTKRAEVLSDHVRLTVEGQTQRKLVLRDETIQSRDKSAAHRAHQRR